MFRTLSTAPLLALLLSGALAAQQHRAPPGSYPEHRDGYASGGLSYGSVSPHLSAAIWRDGGDDLFRRGERVRLRFRVSDDAYVAVVHIGTGGEMELLYPYNAWNDGFVRGPRVYSVASNPASLHWSANGRDGIGYIYLLGSPVPLDLDFFRQRRGYAGDPFGGRRLVRGDPFYAMDNLLPLLLPRWRYAGYAEDVFTYYLGDRHRYPSYACYDRTPERGWFDSPYYPRCDRVTTLLGYYPSYYDTRRYRGDRRVYQDRLRGGTVTHGYKERADLPLPASRDPRAIGSTRLGRENAGAPATGRAAPRAAPREEQPVQPSSRRPTLRRRPDGRSGGQSAEPARRPEPSRRPEPPRRSEPPQRSEPPPQRQRAEPPRAEPQRAEPASQPEPRGRRSSPPRRPASRPPA